MDLIKNLKLGNLQIGDACYWAFDDRPLEGCGIIKCKVIGKHSDHILLTNFNGGDMKLWAELDDEDSTCRTFKTLKEALSFLKMSNVSELGRMGVQ